MNKEQIDALRASNQERIAALASKGAEVPFGAVIQLAINTLVEHVLMEGSPARRRYEEAFERGMEELIVNAEQYLARLILTAGVDPATQQAIDGIVTP